MCFDPHDDDDDDDNGGDGSGEPTQTLSSNTAWYPSYGSQISRFKGVFLQRKQAWETQKMVHRVIRKGF